MLIAAFLTLWLAMRLELPQPRTAMITVFIVMQPQSGQVFAGNFYRFLGTLAGSAVMVLLIALFAQNTELFLGALAIWVGICTAGATRNPRLSRLRVCARGLYSGDGRLAGHSPSRWRLYGSGMAVVAISLSSLFHAGQRRDPAADLQRRDAQCVVPTLRRVRAVRHRWPARAQPA